MKKMYSLIFILLAIGICACSKDTSEADLLGKWNLVSYTFNRANSVEISGIETLSTYEGKLTSTDQASISFSENNIYSSGGSYEVELTNDQGDVQNLNVSNTIAIGQYILLEGNKLVLDGLNEITDANITSISKSSLMLEVIVEKIEVIQGGGESVTKTVGTQEYRR